MATTLNVLKESPLDSMKRGVSGSLVQINSSKEQSSWVPSKFNARTRAEDGSLVLWNTYTGSINVFKPEHRLVIEKLLSREGISGELKGVAKYLYERGYIVSKRTNEYRQFQLAFGQQHYRTDILELILLASEDCNFRCTYCYEDFQRGTMLPSVRESIKKMVEKKAAGLDKLSVSWFGGEPLYGFKAIEDLAPFFCETAKKYSINYTSAMTTNGYLLTPDVAEKLLRWNIQSYQITIDGLSEQHDHKRPTRNGEGTFEVILSNLKALKSTRQDFNIRIRVNFDQDNHPHLEKLLTLLEGEFAADPRFGVAFHAVGRWGGANDSQLSVCGIREEHHVKAELEKQAINKGLKLRGTIRDTNTLGGNACYAARPYNFIIGAEGDLMKCTIALDKKDYNVVGKIRDDGELELDHEKYALWVEPAFESDNVCQKCHVLPTCQGISCPLIRFEDNNRPCVTTPKVNLRNELLTIMETSQNRGQTASAK